MQLTLDQKAINDRVFRATREYEEARSVVRPFVGEVMASDAASVYVKALSTLGHDVRELRGQLAASKAVFDVLKHAKPRHIAMDSKAVAARSEMFPNGQRLGR